MFHQARKTKFVVKSGTETDDGFGGVTNEMDTTEDAIWLARLIAIEEIRGARLASIMATWTQKREGRDDREEFIAQGDYTTTIQRGMQIVDGSNSYEVLQLINQRLPGQYQGNHTTVLVRKL